MRNLVKITILVVLLLSILPFDSFSQDQYHNVRSKSVKSIPSYSNSYQYKTPFERSHFTLSVGSGISYGGLYGVMASIKPGSAISIFGAIGQYVGGPPLGFADGDFKLTKDTQTGMGYNVGIKIHPNPNGYYMGFQYINAGNYTYYNTTEPLNGFNWVLIGGTHFIGNSHLLLEWGINVAGVFFGDVGSTMFGVSLGLGFGL